MDAQTLGARVRETRKRKGLTQEELSRMVGLDRTAVIKIENGTRRVAALELSDIADALRVRMAEFFSVPTPSIVSHRSSQGLDTVDSRIDGLLADIANDVEFVQGLAGLTAKTKTPPWNMPTSRDDAEAMAARTREILDTDPDAPLTMISERVSDVGLFVFSRELGPDTADAGTVLLRDGGVCLINSSQKVGRRRLSVAHELAHYLVADEYKIDWRVAGDGSHSSNVESLFDHYARALLLPGGDFRSRWTRTVERSGVRSAAVVLASDYQVDMATLSRRLVDLDAVNAETAGDIRTFRTTKADMIEHDLHAGDELAETVQPRSYQKAVLRLVRDEEISRERAIELLWDTLTEGELPPPRPRAEEELWKYVS